MTMIVTNLVTVNVVISASTESHCTPGMYITIYGSSTTPGSGKSYPYEYSASIPSGYNYSPTPNFCIYYEGGKAPTGCYCNFLSGQIIEKFTTFLTNGKGGWWALITLPNYYSFGIAWNE